MKTILIIDDDELCRLTAAEYLRGHEWNVLEAANGDDGLALAIQHRPDVILSDLLMPKGNGYSVCRAVRGREDMRHTRLVVMSGRDYDTDRTTAKEAGADAFLLKPVPMADLLAAVNTSTENGSAPAPAATPPPVTPASAEDAGEMVLRFWGVRGSIPTPGPTTLQYGGNTSCVEVRAEGEIIVMDAGTGIRELGISLTKEFPTGLKMTLLMTHTHWDHIQGFPFFKPAYNPKCHITVMGYEGAATNLAGTLKAQMESPFFPIPLDKMPSHLSIVELREMEFKVGAVKVSSCFSKHPGVCVGYRLQTAAGSIVYIPDNEWSATETEAVDGCEPCASPRALLEFIRDADILILDAQYDVAEYAIKKGWGHGCMDEVVRLAEKANVKNLFLFHHDPEHDDAYVTKMLEHAREIVKESGSPLHVEAAREGLKVVLQRAQA